LEAGLLSQWLFSAFAGDLFETRHMRAVLKAQINKTDRNAPGHRTDAGGTLPSAQPEASHAADPPQAITLESY
jgi:hypothetical protein